MATSRCIVCNDPSGIACGSCHSANYCSSICQETDSPTHELLCGRYTNFQDTKPTEAHRIAILFPVDDTTPELVWVPSRHREDEDGVQYLPDATSFLGKDREEQLMLRVGRNSRRGLDLGYNVVIIGRENFPEDGSQPNKSIRRTTQGSIDDPWKGPFLVMHETKLASGDSHYLDVTMADFRHAVDYFKTYGNELADDDVELQKEPKRYSISGVKISCDAECEMFGLDRFSAIQVPKDHPVLIIGHRPRISELCGIPLRVDKMEADPQWTEDPNLSHLNYQNPPVATLFQNANSNDKYGWGYPPMHWRREVGTVLVVRQDGKDVSPREVAALCEYSHSTLRPLFEESMGMHRKKTSREEVLSAMTPEKFQYFFDEFIMEPNNEHGDDTLVV